ncbi:MAG: hypothetical protein COU06_02225, partial [Candidatus Harrisonbacteria bacterium CG10_big_fil_rev_8_21_14_0_10_38_8]
MNNSYFWSFLIGAAIVVSFFIIVILRILLHRKGTYSYSLGMGLLRVKLPNASPKENEKITVNEIREKIALMEQVYNQLATIKESAFKSFFYGKSFFALELAVPQVGSEVDFYIGVPKRYLSAAEKLIHSVYSEAEIAQVDDYTIFHPEGAVSAASIKTNSRILPIKSYQAIEADPLSSIVNAFSKIAHQEEGLSLQIVARKAPQSFNQKLKKIVEYLREGKNLTQAISHSKKSKIGKSLQSEESKQKEQSNRGPVNESLVQLIEKKSSKQLFEANIRVVASAPTKERADSLLQELTTPFNQYKNEETENELTANKKKGRALQQLIYEYAFRIPGKQGQNILSSEELSSIIHLPNTFIGAPHIASVKSKTAPAPINVPINGLLLGVNTYRGTETKINMSEEDRARHFYIIGQTGTGKTYFMRNMIIQDIEAGHGVCFIDPHGDTAEEILGTIPENRLKDVIYFNPGDIERPMGLNMLEYDPRFPEQKTFVINELLEIFNKLYDMKNAGGPIFEQYFRNATALVMDDPASGNTLLEINRVFVDKAFRDYKLNKTSNPLVKTFWREVAEKAGGETSLQNMVPYISSKFDSFLSNEVMRPIVSQEKSAFRVRDVMDNQKILLINLSKGRLGELNSSLIGLILVGKILMAAFSRVDIPEKDRKPFYLYLDEFQNISTNSIESILSEARKYKLGLIIAHQFISQLTDEIKKAVFGNVGSMASFRIGSEDAEFLEKQFAPTFTASDLINVDNRNCYLRMLIEGQTSRSFNLKTLKGKDSQEKIKQLAIEFSRNQYGRDRA